MKNNKIRTMAYMALYAALYIVLKYVGNLIPFLDMPNGGSTLPVLTETDVHNHG